MIELEADLSATYARITVPVGHGLMPGAVVSLSPGDRYIVASVTATTCVIRAMTRRERWAFQMRKAWRRVVRLWWRAWDAVADRVA